MLNNQELYATVKTLTCRTGPFTIIKCSPLSKTVARLTIPCMLLFTRVSILYENEEEVLRITIFRWFRSPNKYRCAVRLSINVNELCEIKSEIDYYQRFLRRSISFLRKRRFASRRTVPFSRKDGFVSRRTVSFSRETGLISRRTASFFRENWFVSGEQYRFPGKMGSFPGEQHQFPGKIGSFPGE
jgi:hypothetical protein